MNMGKGVAKYILAALVIVGLLTFAIFSRHHAHMMATEGGHGVHLSSDKHTKSGSSSILQQLHTDISNQDKQDSSSKHFPDLVAKELQEIHAIHAEHENILHSKMDNDNSNKLRKETQSMKLSNNQNKAGKASSSDGASSSSSTSTTTGKLHTVTYATHGGKDDRFCRAVESAIRSDYELVILGWGDKWLGLSQKLKAAQSYAQALPPNDMILFTDAFDVLYVNSGDKIVNEFIKFNTDIVFSAECGCWPHIIENKGKACFEDYPKSPTPYRYLNSGTWIGRAAPAAKMLIAVMESAGGDFKNANDQKLVADFYIEGKYGIQLDFYNKLFQSMHMTLDPPLPHCNPFSDIVLVNHDDNTHNKKYGKFYNKRTQSEPTVFHFNGGGKCII